MGNFFNLMCRISSTARTVGQFAMLIWFVKPSFCSSSTVTDPPIIAEIEPPQDILPISADFAVKTRFSLVWFFILFAVSGKGKLINSALCAITADP
jgi:hypothetical protein